ncbi:hypothetical protein OROMI_023587 [Orobanche minor]
MDIEEMDWAPKYGRNGMIDASVCVRSNTASAEANEIIIPLEFKTGKTAMEHSATKDPDNNRVTQNSGVRIVANTTDIKLKRQVISFW